jgi:hypothetical protein
MARRSVDEEKQYLSALTQKTIAWLINVNDRTFRLAKGVPRNDDGTYNAKDVVAWHAERNTDELLSGPVTDNLDRLRAVNADIKTLELEKLRASMVSVADAKTMVFHTLGKVKTSIEHLQRRFGNDAADLVIEAVEVALKDLSDWIATADK